MALIDTHAHPDLFIKRGDFSEILREAAAVGVEKIIAASASFEDWALYSKAAADYAKVHWAVGLHPTELCKDSLVQLEALGSYFTDVKPPVAIGEIGLDFYRIRPADADYAQKVALQKEAFKRQLLIAKQFDCPVIVHARSAVRDCIDLIDFCGVDFEKVVFHCFSGTPVEIKEINERGGRGSFTGIMTYKQADEMREAMLWQGLDKLMLETDCPYLAPVPFRGKECRPSHLAITAKSAAELFGLSLEEISRITTQNAEEFFGI